jgi:hypothetical protein
MRQSGRRCVAPLNSDPPARNAARSAAGGQWPEGYVAVLREAGTQKKTIPFPCRRRRSLGRAEIEVFLSEAAARPSVSNWQIAQARDALELCCEQFWGIALDSRPDDAPSKRPSIQPSVPRSFRTLGAYTQRRIKRSIQKLHERQSPNP